jgi:type I restriction enzyme S subunit
MSADTNPCNEGKIETSQSKNTKSGFKPSEYGLVPNDWDVCKLGEIAHIYSGGTPNRKVPEYWDGQIPWVTTTLIDGVTIDNALEFISEKGVEFSSTRWCKAGTLLMAMYGQGKTRGKVGMLGFDATINQACAAIDLKDKESSKYIFHVLNSMYDKIRESSNSGGQENLSGSIIKGLSVPLPPKEEQTAIANALSDVDALIQELEKLIAKKQAIKTATMQQLLTGRTRLPQFAHHPDGRKRGYKPSELGEIPEDWKVLSLGTASSFSNGRAYALHEWETAGTPVIRLQNLTGRGEDYYYSNMQLPERQYCQEGDLLFMWSATFGPVIWKGPKAIYHYHIWKIICNSGFSQAFMLHLLDDMTEKLKSGSSSGGTMLHVTKHKMETTKAAFPVFQEQAAIGTLLDDMDEEIRALENRLNKTRQIKQGMMQELLTGKTRLVKPAGVA